MDSQTEKCPHGTPVAVATGAAMETLKMSAKEQKRMAAMANVKAWRLRIRVHSCAFVVLTDSTLGAALDI